MKRGENLLSKLNIIGERIQSAFTAKKVVVEPVHQEQQPIGLSNQELLDQFVSSFLRDILSGTYRVYLISRESYERNRFRRNPVSSQYTPLTVDYFLFDQGVQKLIEASEQGYVFMKVPVGQQITPEQIRYFRMRAEDLQ